jgi:1-acyl-sn-glycerol-3-phosphate acyltransferase
MILFLRSALFNAGFFVMTATVAAVFLPLLLGPPRLMRRAMRRWVGFLIWWMRVSAGIALEVTGTEHLPREGEAALIAGNHESAFDTIVWFWLVPDVCYVMKRELFLLPLYGWWAKRSGHVGVDREGSSHAMRRLMKDGKRAAEAKRQLVIFPEGTRAAPGTMLPLQPGIAALAAATRLPVIPAATNSGDHWGRRRFLRPPGVIRIRVLPPLPPRLPKEALMQQLEPSLAAVVPRPRFAASGGQARPSSSRRQARPAP